MGAGWKKTIEWYVIIGLKPLEEENICVNWKEL